MGCVSASGAGVAADRVAEDAHGASGGCAQ
jgi:hypothetical protein